METAEQGFWLAVAGLLGAGVRMATPLLFAGLGEVLTERAGVLNVGLEGVMLVGAFGGAVGAFLGGSPWVGLCAGMAAGSLLAALFALWTVYRRADQVVVGTAINLLALGLTGVFWHAVPHLSGVSQGAFRAPAFAGVAVPGLSSLPVIGPAFFSRDSGINILVYVALALVPLTAFVLYRTRLGLQLRAAGEHPQAAEAAGADVLRLRFATVVVAGALAGAGGVFLAIGHLNTFVEGMVAGRGFIALAVVIFGRWSPWGVLGASLLFGLAQGAEFALGARGTGLPPEALRALPYLATLVALVLRFGRTAAPAALAQPFQRG